MSPSPINLPALCQDSTTSPKDRTDDSEDSKGCAKASGPDKEDKIGVRGLGPGEDIEITDSALGYHPNGALSIVVGYSTRGLRAPNSGDS